MRVFNCLQCGTENKWSHQTNNKFCNVKCSSSFKSEEAKKRFWAGEYIKSIDRPLARKYIAERRGYKCEVCGIKDWMDKDLTLQVDHIDGDPSNDHPDNLRLICPNCHSQTPFLGGANKGRGRDARGMSLR